MDAIGVEGACWINVAFVKCIVDQLAMFVS